jgi:antitoxin component YwqK of YwqJK toxin-antitoxin module
MNTRYSKLALAFLLIAMVGCGTDGLHVKYYDNGQKAEEGLFKDGKLDGLWTDWHENGQKREERHYKNDKQ